MPPSPAASTPAGRPDVHQQVIDWRRQVLEDVGYPSELARKLATEIGIDLHEACGLLERIRAQQKARPPEETVGETTDPAELAARILA